MVVLSSCVSVVRCMYVYRCECMNGVMCVGMQRLFVDGLSCSVRVVIDRVSVAAWGGMCRVVLPME